MCEKDQGGREVAMEMIGRRLVQAEKTADVKVSTGVCLAHSRSGMEQGWEETKDMRSEEQRGPDDVGPGGNHERSGVYSEWDAAIAEFLAEKW